MNHLNIPIHCQNLSKQLEESKHQISNLESIIYLQKTTLLKIQNLANPMRTLDNLDELKNILVEKNYSLLLQYNKFSSRILFEQYDSNNKVLNSYSFGSISHILINVEEKIINHIMSNLDDIEYVDEDGWKIIHNICINIMPSSLKILVDKGIDLYSESGVAGSPIELYSYNSSYLTLKYLLSIVDKTKINSSKIIIGVCYNPKLSGPEKEDLIKKLKYTYSIIF